MNVFVPTQFKLGYSASDREIALTAVYEISKVLTAPQALEPRLASVIAMLSSYMQMRRGMILMLDTAGEPELAASAGEGAGRTLKSKSILPQGAIDQIVATSTPLIIEDIGSHRLFTNSAYLRLISARAKMSFIGVPIKVDGEAKGVLSIDHDWSEGAELRLEQNVRFLTVIANMIGQTVQMHRLARQDRERLIEQAHRLEKQLADARESSRPTAPIPLNAVGIVGDSLVMRQLLDKVAAAARSNATVLLRGETGTGKELFARAIHDYSPRAKQSFIKVNLAALPESMLESELFGHEKGAFTGAIAQRAGRFELADKGTLFLDEIGEISAAFQAKLLRVLQEGEFERVGGAKTLKVDARIVCATNRNLEDAVAKSEFRADLYYRINVVTLLLPPLRDRPDDVPDLAETFLQRFCDENLRQMRFSPSAIDILSHCAFPGNVRELENCVRRTATLAADQTIKASDFACQQGLCLSASLWKGRATPLAGRTNGEIAPPPAKRALSPLPQTAPKPSAPPAVAATSSAPACSNPCSGPCSCNPAVSERDQLVAAMERSGWVQAKAGRILHLTPRQIGYALRKHHIDVPKF